jgi:hypothetical protein
MVVGIKIAEYKPTTEDLLVLMLVAQIWQSQFLGVQMLQNLVIGSVLCVTNTVCKFRSWVIGKLLEIH